MFKCISWHDALSDSYVERREALYVALVQMMKPLKVNSLLIGEGISRIFEEIHGVFDSGDSLRAVLLPFELGGVPTYRCSVIDDPIIFINHSGGIATLYVEDFLSEYKGGCFGDE